MCDPKSSPRNDGENALCAECMGDSFCELLKPLDSKVFAMDSLLPALDYAHCHGGGFFTSKKKKWNARFDAYVALTEMSYAARTYTDTSYIYIEEMQVRNLRKLWGQYKQFSTCCLQACANPTN
jgi:hypothetical protein